MSKNDLQGYENDRFTYVSPHDPFFKRMVIKTVENLSGRKYLHKIYQELKNNDPNPIDVCENALKKLNISMDYDEKQLDKVPKTGPVIFVGNHPFGIVDGFMFCHLVTRVRHDYFILINEVLCHEPVMEKHLLPVDFRKGDEAMATNLNTKEETTKRLNEGKALMIFPAGAVATALSFGGKVEELPWRKFICTRIHETKCTVVPVFFHGENSGLFQFVSKISMNLRLGLLLHEVMNKRGKKFRIEIGNPIAYDEMEQYEDRQELIEFLNKRTMALRNVN